jgi:UDP-glucose 4-epimerase
MRNSMMALSEFDAAPRTMMLLGGTGFLGTHLAARLRCAGHRVLITGRAPTARDGSPAIGLPLDDVAAIVARARSEGVDTVVHLACQLLPSSTETAYAEELAEITLPMFRLARELAASGIRLAFLSSGGTVYGASTWPRVAEHVRCQPISLYGQAKLEAELHLDFLTRISGLRLLIFRPSNPYGLYQPLRGAQGLVSVILGRMIDGTPLDIWGDGLVVRDYIHVDDAIDAMAGLIERNAEGTFNIGSGVGHSLLDVVRSIEQVTGRSLSRRFHPARAADVPRLVLDVTRLAAAGLHKARSLTEGVRYYAGQLGLTHDH